MSEPNRHEHPSVFIRPDKPVRDMTDAEIDAMADEVLDDLRSQRDAFRTQRDA